MKSINLGNFRRKLPTRNVIALNSPYSDNLPYERLCFG